MKTRLFTCSVMVLAICAASHADGQNKDVLQNTIKWNSSQNVNLLTQETFTRSAKFVTTSTEKIETGSLVNQTFTITSTQGEWTNVDQAGMIQYSVTIDGKSGTITIERNSQELFLVVDIPGADGIRQKFIISSVEIL